MKREHSGTDLYCKGNIHSEGKRYVSIFILNSGQKDVEVFCVALVTYKLTLIYEINDSSAKHVNLKKNLIVPFGLSPLSGIVERKNILKVAEIR